MNDSIANVLEMVRSNSPALDKPVMIGHGEVLRLIITDLVAKRLSCVERRDDAMAAAFNKVLGYYLSPDEMGRIEADTPSPPPRFTTFCQGAGTGGTIHITSMEAGSVEEAIGMGRAECLEDWNAGGTGGEGPLYTLDNIHCLGVASGDCEIVFWEDQGEEL